MLGICLACASKALIDKAGKPSRSYGLSFIHQTMYQTVKQYGFVLVIGSDFVASALYR